MGKRVSIGLDIGSSAVRAAEVVTDGNRRVLRRFAQVGLPDGAVVEGEVQDKAAVTKALKRLWQQGRFSGKKVVIGLGSQRAMVRQVEMPPMSDAELRPALQFKIGEFLPIPVQQAVVDFAALPGGDASAGTRRLLLVAAQREVVVEEVSAVEAAGLRVTAVDSSPLALLRAVAAPKGPAARGGTGEGFEAVVGVGAQLITVAVRFGGAPRFVRTVALSGPANLKSAAEMVGTVPKGRYGPGPVNLAGGGEDTGARLDTIVNEVRSSLEYLLSQSGTGHFEQVLLTGGGAMLPGVTQALAGALRLPVELAELPMELDQKELALDKDALHESSYRWLTAAGLALWGSDSYGKVSLLPVEVLAKRRQRTVVMSAAAGVVVMAAGLGVVSYGQVRSADNVSSEIRSENLKALDLDQKIRSLGYVLKVPAEVQSRRALAVDALTGDIDWTGLLQRIAAVMPSDVVPQTISLTKTEPIPTGGTAAPANPGIVVGGITMTAETSGGAAAVADFINRVSHVKGLFALWVSSTQKASGLTTISAAAQVTVAAFSSRGTALPGGSK